MPVFKSIGSEFMVPLDSHTEICDLAENRFNEGTRPFNATMALQEVPDPAGLSVRYRTAQYMVYLFRNPKEIPEEAGPSEGAALLKVETRQPLPVTDEWPNDYISETFTAGLIHPRFQHFEHALWKYDLGIEHHFPDDGMLTVGPYFEAAMSEIESDFLLRLLAKGDTRKKLDEADQRVSLAELNRAHEAFPRILEEYARRRPIERLIGVQSLLNAADLVEIGCEPNPFVRMSE